MILQYSNDTEYLANGLETYGYEFLVHNDWHGAIVWYKPEKKKYILLETILERNLYGYI